MGNSGPKISFQDDSALPRPQFNGGPRQATNMAAPTAGLPRPQCRASTPISLNSQQSLEDGLPRPVMPRPKAAPPTRSRSPLPFVPDRTPRLVQGMDIAGKRHGGRSNQQRTQSDLLRTRTPSTNPQLMVMWLTLLAQLGSLSSIFMEIQESPNKDQLAGMIIDAFAASTLFRYTFHACPSFCRLVRTFNWI